MCVIESDQECRNIVWECPGTSRNGCAATVLTLLIVVASVFRGVPVAHSQQEGNTLAAARRLAESADWHDRITSAELLMDAPDAEAIPLLAELAADGVGQVRRRAVLGLVLRGSQSVQALIALAENDDWRVRANAFAGLTTLGDAAGASVARKGLTDPNTHVRCAAIDALGASAGDEAVAEIVGAARGARSSIRSAAVETIRRIGTTTALAALGKMLESDNFFVRDQASMALSAAGLPAVPHLVEALSSPERDARCLAARSLGLIGSGDERRFKPVNRNKTKKSWLPVRVGGDPRGIW